jgi:hypothetical protein
MMFPRTNTEMSISNEGTLAHHVLQSHIMMDTPRNPFNSGGGCGGRVEEPKGKAVCAPSHLKPPLAFSIERNSLWPQGSTCSPFSQSGTKGVHERQPSHVVSPYVVELNEELEGNFDLFNAQMPVLPCELDELAIVLPELSSPSKKTLILDLDETLIHTYDPSAVHGFPATKRRPLVEACFTSEEGEQVDVNYWPRPHVEEFLTRLAPVFEIIVTLACHPSRYSQRGSRSMRGAY